MNYVIWCATCETIRVPRPGQTCIRCTALIEALINPDTRTPPQPRPPLGARILNRITGRTNP